MVSPKSNPFAYVIHVDESIKNSPNIFYVHVPNYIPLHPISIS